MRRAPGKGCVYSENERATWQHWCVRRIHNAVHPSGEEKRCKKKNKQNKTKNNRTVEVKRYSQLALSGFVQIGFNDLEIVVDSRVSNLTFVKWWTPTPRRRSVRVVSFLVWSLGSFYVPLITFARYWLGANGWRGIESRDIEEERIAPRAALSNRSSTTLRQVGVGDHFGIGNFLNSTLKKVDCGA